MVQYRVRQSIVIGLGLALLGASAARADATRQDAIADVKAAVAALKTDGASATFAAISDPKGKYVKGDLYLVAYDMNGVVLAHGFNKTLIGRDLSKAKDPDGRTYVQERVDMAKTQKSFWQSYKYMEPSTHSLRMKDSYCEKAADAIIICGGIYH